MQLFSFLTIIALLLISSTFALPKHHPPPHPEDNTYTYRHDAANLNELSADHPCRNISLLYARGSHTKGNAGKAGPFFDAVANITGYDALAVQGLKYPASISDYLWNRFYKGVWHLSDTLNATKERCPNTKLVLIGYSQGAIVVRKWAEEASTAERDFVKSGKSLYPVSFKTPTDDDSASVRRSA